MRSAAFGAAILLRAGLRNPIQANRLSHSLIRFRQPPPPTLGARELVRVVANSHPPVRFRPWASGLDRRKVEGHIVGGTHQRGRELLHALAPRDAAESEDVLTPIDVSVDEVARWV